MKKTRRGTWTAAPTLAVMAIICAANQATAGGIWFVSSGPQSISTSGFRYDAGTNSFSATSWRYHPSIGARETYEIFQAVRTNDEIIEDITPSGNATASGLPRESKVAKRMIVADVLLGDITKGFGYITPIYRLANDYVPVPYLTRAGSQRFEANYLFVPSPFVISNGVLTSPGHTIKGVDRPVKVQSDGTRVVDTEAAARGIKDPAIEKNMAHVLENVDYYSKERVVQEMFAYAEVAEFARVLKQSGVDLGAIWKSSP